MVLIKYFVSSARTRYWAFASGSHMVYSLVIVWIKIFDGGVSDECFKIGLTNHCPCHDSSMICAQTSGLLLVQACPGKSVVRWTDRPAMAIAVALGRKGTKQTKRTNINYQFHFMILHPYMVHVFCYIHHVYTLFVILLKRAKMKMVPPIGLPW